MIRFTFITIIALALYGAVSGIARADDAQIKIAIERIRKAGEPATSEEAERWYATPPAGENAAEKFQSAFAKLHVENMSESPALPVIGKGKLPEAGASVSPAMKNGITSALAANREALEILHDATKVKECRYPADFRKGWDMPLPYLVRIKSSALLLGLEAVNAADDGRTTRAVDAIADIFKLGESLKNEPVVISQLVRIACNRTGCNVLEWVLNRRALSEDQLHALDAALIEAENPQAMTRALIADRVPVIALFQKPLTERKPFLEKAAKEVSGEPMNVNTEDWDGDFRSYMAIMDELITTSREVSSKSSEKADAIGKRALLAVNQRHFCTSLFVPALNRSVAKNVSDIALLRCAEAVVGIERYRRAHDYHLPETLQELTPKFLEHIPGDPYGEGPVSFEKRTGGGYKVSSSGKDGSKPIAITIAR